MEVFSEKIKGKAGRRPLSCYGNEKGAQDGGLLFSKGSSSFRGSGSGGQEPTALPHPCVSGALRACPLLRCQQGCPATTCPANSHTCVHRCASVNL